MRAWEILELRQPRHEPVTLRHLNQINREQMAQSDSALEEDLAAALDTKKRQLDNQKKTIDNRKKALANQETERANRETVRKMASSHLETE